MSALQRFYTDWLSHDAMHLDTRGGRRPFVLRQIYRVSLFAAFIVVLASVLAPFNLGDYTINDRHMDGRTFLWQGGWYILLGTLTVSVWLARDLHFGKARVRFVLVGLWLAGLLAYDPSRPDASQMLLEYLGLGAIVVWYLFWKAAPLAYFAHGSSTRSGAAAG